MNEKKRQLLITIISFALVFFIVAVCLLIKLNIDKNRQVAIDESIAKEQETTVVETKVYDDNDPAGENWGEENEAASLAAEAETVIEGDPGDDSEPLDITSPLKSLLNVPHTRDSMIKLAIESLESIPFKEGGRDCYYQGYVRFPDGVDNYMLSATAYGDLSNGMDSTGYVIWLYRNTFGICDENYLNLVDAYNTNMKVNESDLEVGDIGLYTDEEGKPNHYGVCVGFDNGVPVFAHCTGLFRSKLPMGTNIVSHLLSASNTYMYGYPPVEFNYFFRPDVVWEEE